jgi:hypothetical protein
MLTYQIRRPTFRCERPEDRLEFPNETVVQFLFEPEIPFGGVTGKSRTVATHSPITATWDSNTGRHWAEAETPFEPLDVTIQHTNMCFEFKGNRLTVSQRCDSLNDLNNSIEIIYYAFPAMLNVDFIDSPVISQVTGTVGAAQFVWGLFSGQSRLDITNTDHQQERVALAWDRLQLILPREKRRLLAATHYFYVACRLERAGHTPYEFMSEVLLNLSKTLETLFPGSPGETVESARIGLKRLGYSSKEVEKNFIPAMVLRNRIDVGHVSLTIFTSEELSILHQYTEDAEKAFREMLERVFDKMASGEFVPMPYSDSKSHSHASAVIERLRQHQVGKGNTSGGPERQRRPPSGRDRSP